MKMFNLNSRLARRATATLALGLLLGAQTAMACTVDNWNGGNSGNVTAGGPNLGGIARYSGVCAMQTPDAQTAWVQDDSPGGIERIRARFYAFSGNTADAVVYRGFNGGGAEIFRVILRASGAVTLSSGGSAISANGNDNAWNSIEIDWNGTSGDLTLIMNGGTPQTTTFTSPGLLSSVRLGNLDGAAGTMNFDAYESRRTTEIGPLLACDAQPDESINILDALAVINEINEVSLATGQPDCSENGSVDILDVLDIINIINT